MASGSVGVRAPCALSLRPARRPAAHAAGRTGRAWHSGTVADLRRSTKWAGLQPGDPVRVEGTRLRGAAWQFVAHVTNGDTGEQWVEVVGGRAGDRAVRSFRPDQLYAVAARPGRDPSLADAPGLPLD